MRLVVIDPLLSFLGKADRGRPGEVRQVLETLQAMAGRCKTAIVGISHFAKSATGSPLNRVLGSQAYGAVVRAALGVARDPEDSTRQLLLPVKGNRPPNARRHLWPRWAPGARPTGSVASPPPS